MWMNVTELFPLRIQALGEAGGFERNYLLEISQAGNVFHSESQHSLCLTFLQSSWLDYHVARQSPIFKLIPTFNLCFVGVAKFWKLSKIKFPKQHCGRE